MQTDTDRQRLFDENYIWALKIAGKRHQRMPACVQLAEMQSAALEGLWDATGRWDGVRRFKTFASWRIRGAVLDYLRSLYPRGVGRSAGRDMRTHQLSCVRVDDNRELDPADERCHYDGVDEHDEIAGLLRPLSERQRNVIRQHLHGCRMKEIGRCLGVSESQVSHIVSDGLTELRGFWSKQKPR